MATLQLIFSILFLGWVQAQTAANCPSPNGYFPDASQCDKYLECRDGVAQELKCPDGLLVNIKAAAFRNPCDYPIDVDCGSRTLPPAGEPNGSCLRKWGMFKNGNSCGDFVTCVDGIEHQFKCPEGLAWHPELWRCEWPDQVSTCNVEEFLGFKCPSVDELTASSIPRYAHPIDCARFFVCIEGTKPRLLVCGAKTVFDPVTGICSDPANVPKCVNYYPSDPAETTAI